MKIALNCAFYERKGGGIKEYIDNLVTNLVKLDTPHEFIIYVLEDQLQYAKDNLPEGVRIKAIPFKSGSKFNRIKRSLMEGNFWKKEEKEERFDIFHSPFFHAPNLKKAKILLTVHDLRLYRFPDTYEFFRYQFLKRKVRDSIRNADHIISISEFTKKEILELCKIPEDRVTVIHEAINQNRFSSKELNDTPTPNDIPEILKHSQFLLTVGHMEPRKNYDRLIEAFLKLKKDPQFKDFKLVIVGKKDHSFKETLRKIESCPDIFYLNFVEGNTLLWLYKNTSLFVFPSIYEGFGFPPLEAASLNTISAVSKLSSIPEVCGEAAIYFYPYNVNEIAEALKVGLTDEKRIEEIRSKLQSQLDKFSWERNARETLTLYNELNS